MRRKILCVEDDATMQALVTGSLADYQVLTAGSIQEAQKIISNEEVETILLDIELPDGDGLKFLTTLAQDTKYKSIPILILTGHSDISNKLIAFSIGADDFVSKPFDPLELNARVTAKLRRRSYEKEVQQSRRIGNVEIDFDRQKAFAYLHGKERDLQLTAIELRILSLLTKRLEQVYSREQILNEIWGNVYVSDRTVDSHIAHLRQKILETELVVDTVKSFGYRALIKK